MLDWCFYAVHARMFMYDVRPHSRIIQFAYDASHSKRRFIMSPIAIIHGTPAWVWVLLVVLVYRSD